MAKAHVVRVTENSHETLQRLRYETRKSFIQIIEEALAQYQAK
jgi:hypothetical protein